MEVVLIALVAVLKPENKSNILVSHTTRDVNSASDLRMEITAFRDRIQECKETLLLTCDKVNILSFQVVTM